MLHKILGYFFYGTARIANRNAVIRNIFNHHRTGADNDITAYCYSAQNTYIAANPYIITNLYKVCGFQALIALLGIKWVAGGIKAAVWTDKYIVAEFD